MPSFPVLLFFLCFCCFRPYRSRSQLPYAITIDYETEQLALAAPTLSIPAKGYVPQQIESFLVHLPCTGNTTQQVPLSVNMLVRGPPRTNDTKLHFKRNKICLKGKLIRAAVDSTSLYWGVPKKVVIVRRWYTFLKLVWKSWIMAQNLHTYRMLGNKDHCADVVKFSDFGHKTYLRHKNSRRN